MIVTKTKLKQISESPSPSQRFMSGYRKSHGEVSSYTLPWSGQTDQGVLPCSPTNSSPEHQSRGRRRWLGGSVNASYSLRDVGVSSTRLSALSYVSSLMGKAASLISCLALLSCLHREPVYAVTFLPEPPVPQAGMTQGKGKHEGRTGHWEEAGHSVLDKLFYHILERTRRIPKSGPDVPATVPDFCDQVPQFLDWEGRRMCPQRRWNAVT